MSSNGGSGTGVLAIQEMLDVVRADLRTVERFMAAAMASDIELVRNVAGHVLASGGKRLRPALVLLAGRASGGDPRDLVPLAGALELIHTATLIHDDIVDGSRTRRGVQTVARRWGAGVAVLTGDLMFATAFAILSDHEDGGGMLGLMSRVIGDMCRGEIEQYAARGDLDQTEDAYLKRIGLKTASLMAACTSIGAAGAGADEDLRQALYDYGYNLGMVFQVRDDILDFEGAVAYTGKDITADVMSGVVTLPLIYALEDPEAGPEIRSILGNGTEYDAAGAARVAELVVESGGVEGAAAMAARYQALALEAVENLDTVPARMCLEHLVEFAGNRAS